MAWDLLFSSDYGLFSLFVIVFVIMGVSKKYGMTTQPPDALPPSLN